jgi:hypothetical protein
MNILKRLWNAMNGQKEDTGKAGSLLTLLLFFAFKQIGVDHDQASTLIVAVMGGMSAVLLIVGRAHGWIKDHRSAVKAASASAPESKPAA